MRTTLALIAGVLLVAITVATQTRTTLEVYVVDVEGGNAVLFVTPAGESVLIDAGNADPNARDANRIMEAIKDAGLARIDHLIITHWHGDHFGGLADLAKQVPIREFIDHGPNVQPGAAADEFLTKTYPELTKAASRRIVKPGDRIALTAWMALWPPPRGAEDALAGRGCAQSGMRDVRTG
jgi:glyoxylase-like metal-dependent hydrolase (beta-lactamase superfamily II)